MENELYFELGLGTRFRRLVEAMATSVERFYAEQGVPFKSGHFYAFYAVALRGPQTINEISKLAGFSHSAVSQTVKKLVNLGLFETRATDDGRQKAVHLTAEGSSLYERFKPMWAATDGVVKDAIAESGHDFMTALSGFEAALNRSSIYERLMEKSAKPSTPAPLIIQPYHAKWRQAFYDMNMRWLEAYFKVEPIDKKVLSDPETHILDTGGEIYFVEQEGRAVGTVAMKLISPGVFELTKLAVDPDAQGGGMGQALCEKVIERFLARGGKTLFLETNTKLQPAIKLYHKLNFVEKPNPYNSPYERSNYYMEWEPTQTN